jgi:hypothetical protein
MVPGGQRQTQPLDPAGQLGDEVLHEDFPDSFIVVEVAA